MKIYIKLTINRLEKRLVYENKIQNIEKKLDVNEDNKIEENIKLDMKEDC